MFGKGLLAVFSALALTLVAWAPAWSHEGATGNPGYVIVTPDQVQWSDAPSLGPGVKIAVLEGTMKDENPFTALIKFPANFKIPVHTHPETERFAVLSGNVHLGIGDEFDRSEAATLPPGSIAVMKSGVEMFAFTGDEEAVIEIHGKGPWGINYLHPEENPAVRK